MLPPLAKELRDFLLLLIFDPVIILTLNLSHQVHLLMMIILSGPVVRHFMIHF